MDRVIVNVGRGVLEEVNVKSGVFVLVGGAGGTLDNLGKLQAESARSIDSMSIVITLNLNILLLPFVNDEGKFHKPLSQL